MKFFWQEAFSLSFTNKTSTSRFFAYLGREYTFMTQLSNFLLNYANNKNSVLWFPFEDYLEDGFE